MNGKKVLITGASRGIGRGIAEYLLAQGAEVALVARNEEKLIELEKQYPGRAHIYPYDLTDLENIEDIFRYCSETIGKLDGMFHAAGISESQPIRFTDVEDIKKTMDINYGSTVQLIRFFMMKKYSANESSIVVMSSPASWGCAVGMGQYSASKAAVSAFVKVAAKEGKTRRIRVNAIAPNYLDTDMVRAAKEGFEYIQEHVKNEQPFGFIPVEQIAYLAEFLISEKSEYITGAIVPVSGGADGVMI